jgi:hypothetical protein
MDYASFLSSKAPAAPPSGLTVVPPLPAALKPFQQVITAWALRRGRAAMFEGTGLGKTLQQLAWADAVAAEEDARVLVLTPLAVAEQTVAEAAKFGIPSVAYARDHAAAGTNIVVTNYERFEKFDVSQFAGIVLDECFAAGTPVDLGDGRVMNVENIAPGMYIKNAVGVDCVMAIARREVFGAVIVSAGSASYVCSPDHPWLTELGWVPARALRANDLLVATDTAMRLVCNPIPTGGERASCPTFLREVLLSEMADEHAGAQSEGAHGRDRSQARALAFAMAPRDAGRTGTRATMDQIWSYAGSTGELIACVAGERTSATDARRERSSDDRTATADAHGSNRVMVPGICNLARAKNARIPDTLQGGYRQPGASDWDRGGWAQPSQPQGTGYEERQKTGFTRVESVEVLELGNPRLDQFRDAGGKLYFYDIEAERHPSFSVGGNLVHNSGIIKSQDGKTRSMLTEACLQTPWKLCCTATPAPNDYTELGQHAEFLGVMTAKEMLSMFFVHDGSIRADDHSQGNDGWRLKRHAATDFWRWLASWSVMVRHPADLGFDEPGYDLPPLRLEQVTVAAEYKPTAGLLFPTAASTLGERIGVRKDTAEARVLAAVEIVSRDPDKPWLIWCNLNSEADAIERLLPRSMQVAGRHDVELKVNRLLGFKEGQPPILISKPSLAGHGMNWQHCARMVFVGLTDSFEQVYQAIRRCWRFGQARPVDVYFIASELEGAVVANLRRKETAFDAMLDAMSGHMRDLMRENVIGGRNASAAYNPQIPMKVPEWLLTA